MQAINKCLRPFFFDPNSSHKLACCYTFFFTSPHFALGAFTLPRQEINWRECMVAKLARIFYNCGSTFRGELREQFGFPGFLADISSKEYKNIER